MSILLSYSMQPPNYLGIVALVGLCVLGIGMFYLAVRSAKGARNGPVLPFAVIGLVVIGLGVGLYFLSASPTVVNVGNGYVSVESSSISGTGNLNVTSSEIASAYIAQIGSGNFTLSKQHGTNIGSLNIGVFTLGNGATAYVVSDNSTDLIIKLNSGSYVILGPSHTSALALSFSQNVHRING